jgi:hypothetical protein
MPRLFVGNFEFEHRLVDPSRVLPARLARLNAELATAWLSMADDGDFVWTPGEIPHEFWDAVAAEGLPRLQPVADWTRWEGRATLVPWGWTGEFRDHARVHEQSADSPDPKVVRQINSRRWSAEREAAWGTGLDLAAACHSLDDIAAAIQRLPPHRVEWVVKAEFGMSGRERFLGRGPLRDEAAGWARRRLAHDGVVFFEPWVERWEEIGIAWDVPQQGSPVLIGVAPMLLAVGGHYRGSGFAGGAGLLTRFSPDGATGQETRPTVKAGPDWWDAALAVTLRAAEDAQRAGYHGPFGVDVMQYRDHAGAVRVRPLQDVNARWSMGRLALGWRRHFPRAEAGYWWHGPASQCPGHSELSGTLRVVRTSPALIDGEPVQHVTTVVVREPSAT